MTRYIADVMTAAADGALVLTANKRLFRHLREKFDQQMLAAGKKVWSTPQIFSFDGWLNRCLEELGESWRLINSHQQQWLWEQEIEKSSRGTSLELLQVPKTAEKAIQAHRLLCEYNLNLDDEFLTEDQRVFRNWQNHYRALCHKREWLDPGELPHHICMALADGRLDMPSSLLLVGFDQLSPGLLQLMAVIGDGGGDCREVMLHTGKKGRMVRFAAADSAAEIETAARWARRLLDDGASSIGIVVPDLQMRRRQIERIFREQIDPQATVALHDEESIFGLSLGAPLVEQGVVYAALELLGTGRQVTLEQVSFLLRTPYLGGAVAEGDGRARFEQTLRSFRQQTFKLAHLTALSAGKSELTTFTAILEHLKVAAAGNDQVLPGVWAERFANQLHALGWPGERTLASREYQAINVWQEKGLAALVALDSLQQPIGRSQALQLLRRSCQEIEFQLESAPGPVQVVGLLESSGLNFDHLWVMGVGETVLPARPQPNPFIPVKIQRQYDMPHASAARELQFADQVMARLQVASSDIVFSCPRKDGDTPLRPSPLIPEEAVAGDPDVAPRHDIVALVKEADLHLEEIADYRGPAVTATPVEGGSRLLQDQAHCPFRAFVHHRLKGEQLPTGSPGIDPLTRGNLLHLVLEKIWRKLGHQSKLLDLDEQQRISLIETQVTLAIDSYYSNRTVPAPQLLRLEAERMVILLAEWLQKEAEREPFSVVETEQEHVKHVGPLRIRLKIDRIDELDDGSRVVIDYKTGSKIEPKDFLTRPLIEPQLPVYAVTDVDSTPAGLVFARLRRGECKFAGMTCEPGILKGVKDFSKYPPAQDLGIDSWDELIHFWKGELTKLATDFATGEAHVRPYDTKKSCQYCDLIGLCRITEANHLSGGES